MVKPSPTQAVILAGGLARRLGRLAAATPKYLLPIAGLPFAARQLTRLAQLGITEVVLCIGHMGHQIEAAIGDGARYGVRVVYSHEGPRRRGTAGALRLALPLLRDSFILSYGDSYLPFDYLAPLRQLWRTEGARACMAVHCNEGRWDRSNVALAGDWVIRYDKRERPPFRHQLDHIDYGASAMRREVVAALAAGEGDLAPLFARLAQQGQLAALRVKQRFYEIGSVAGYAELNQLWNAQGDPAERGS